MSRRDIDKFNGGYGRIGEIWVENHECNLCGKEKICVATDGSEGEYNSAWICSDCVKRLTRVQI